MTNQPRQLHRSFAGGQVSPQMFSRPDDGQVANGAAMIQNMICAPQGSLYRRPGLQFVQRCKEGSTDQRLFSFTFSLGDSVVIESGRSTVNGRKLGYFRFHTDGGTVLYEQPNDHIASTPVISHVAGLWDTPLTSSLSTGDPIVITPYADGTSATISYPSAAVTEDQLFGYSGANLGVGAQFMFQLSAGASLPSNVKLGKLYWVTSVNGTSHTFSESYKGPNVKGVAAGGTGVIRLASMPLATDPDDQIRANHVYYATQISGTTLRLARSRADAIDGTAISIANNGEGPWRSHFAYVPGDLAHDASLSLRNYYCMRAPWCSAPDPFDFDEVFLEDHLDHPTSTDFWVEIPGDWNASVSEDLVGNRITWAAHGLSNGDPIVFTGTGLAAPIVEGVPYYVRNGLTNSFQLSATPQGEILDLTSTSTLLQGLANSFYEVPHFYTGEQLPRITTAQSFDVLSIASRDHPPAELRRISAQRWELSDVQFGAQAKTPNQPFLVDRKRGEGINISNVTTASPAVITVIAEPPVNAITSSLWIEGGSDVGLDDGLYIVESVTGAAPWNITLRDVESGNSIGGLSPGGAPASARIHISDLGVTTENKYRVTAIDVDAAESPASTDLEISNNLLVPEASNTIGWQSVQGAVRYRVYKEINGLFGFIGETDELEFTDDNIGPDLSITPPIPDDNLRKVSFVTFNLTSNVVTWTGHTLRDGDPVKFFTNGTTANGGLPGLSEGDTYYVINAGPDSFQVTTLADLSGQAEPFTGVQLDSDADEHYAVAGNFPAAVTYFEGRRLFAGSRNQPQDVWATASGTDSDLSYSLPTVDSDRIYFRIGSREVALIRHLIPLTQLLLMADAMEFRLTPLNTDALTPSSVSIRPQTYIGTSIVRPSLINNVVVFVAERGGHVRELGYSRESFGYLSGDLSLRAEDLFDNSTIVDQAYTKAPIPNVWFPRDDGSMLGLTYIPGEEVGAWHVHRTDGLFKSVTEVSEGDEDRLYAVVERNGVANIERMSARFRSDLANDPGAFFVDHGTTYQGAATTTIGGLDYLEGRDVAYLADGVSGTATIAGGNLVIPKAASIVHVGLPYESRVESVPLHTQSQAFGTGRVKTISKVYVRVYQSGGFVAGRKAALGHPDSTLYASRPLVASEDLVTGVQEVSTPGSWSLDAQYVIKQNDALPLTIVGVTIEHISGD